MSSLKNIANCTSKIGDAFMNNSEKFLIWAAGYDLLTAELCTSSERNKMMIIGMSLFIAPAVAIFSYGYAFSIIFNSYAAAIIGGSISAVVIFLLDRSIIGLGRPGHITFGMLARVMLAFVIGFLLAEPITLKIFSDSIVEEQYLEMKLKKEKIINDYEQKTLELNSKVEAGKSKLNELQKAYTQEMDGTGGSKMRNQGPIYARKYADFLYYREQFLVNQTNAFNDQKLLDQEKKQEIGLLKQTQAVGLIGQLRSLHNLSKKEPIVFWASWLIRILFCLIELIPILIKLTPAGDRLLYYNLIDQKDQECDKIFKINKAERIKLLEKTEKLRFIKQYSDICNQELQAIAYAKEKDSIFLMRSLELMVDKKIAVQQKAIEKIKDHNQLKATMSKIEEIHYGYSLIIKQMLDRSNLNFSQGNA